MGEERVDLAATFVSLTAEAVELRTRVTELREELADLRERMDVVSNEILIRSAGRTR